MAPDAERYKRSGVTLPTASMEYAMLLSETLITFHIHCMLGITAPTTSLAVRVQLTRRMFQMIQMPQLVQMRALGLIFG